jgi:hypothetical protein
MPGESHRQRRERQGHIEGDQTLAATALVIAGYGDHARSRTVASGPERVLSLSARP